MQKGILVDNISKGDSYNLHTDEGKISIRLWFFMISIIGIFVLRDNLRIDIPDFVFIVYYCLCFFSIKKNEIIPFFFFLVPLSVGPLLYAINLIFSIALISSTLSNIKLNKAIFIGMVLIIWEAGHVLLNTFVGYDESIIKLLGFSVCLITNIICLNKQTSRLNYIDVVICWSIGLFALCGIIFMKYVDYYGLSSVLISMKRLGVLPGEDVMSTALMINPNGLGRLITITIFCLLTIFKFEKKYSSILISVVVYFIIFGLLSGSRSFVLVFGITFFIYLIELSFNISKNIKKLTLLAVTTVILSVFVVTYMGSVLDLVAARFADDNITGSRDIIYSQYISKLEDSPLYLLFGSGMQDYSQKYHVIDYTGEYASSHNVILEIVSIWGLTGLFIITLLVLTLYQSLNIKNRILKNTVLAYLPMIGLFLSVQSGQFFIGYYNSLPVLVLVLLNIKYVDCSILKICDKRQ